MTVTFYTLGCKVNQYDTQTLKELFLKEGFSLAKPGESPHVMVVNTCTVTAESDRKGRQALRRFAKRYPDAILAVTGCMPQARPEKAEKLPHAHIVIGGALNHKLPALVKEYLQNRKRLVLHEEHPQTPEFHGLCARSFEGRTRAFVKIEDGCNRFCHYCLIPYARGRVRSKPLGVIKEELEALAANGYKEVVLAGINLTAYGLGLDVNLCDAVELAQSIKGIERIRLGSMEPDQLTPDMIARLGKCHKLCPQFHLSLQSGCDTVLSRMNRRYDTAFYESLIESLRAAFPGCAITTDIMCGYPGETEEEFAQTLAFVKQIGFAKTHCFAYSPREGTSAAKLTPGVPPDVKTARMAKLLQATLAEEKAFYKAQVGQRAEVLFERQNKEGLWEGHTPHYVPVLAESRENLAGQIRLVQMKNANEAGCYGLIQG